MDPQASAEPPNEIAFNILSPQNKANIPFSVSHRILVIALRRQAIENVDSLEGLLSCQFANTIIKPAFLDEPVFLAARSAGQGLHEHKPMPAAALTGSLVVRGQAAGFPDTVTFYSIRRRMATNLCN
jgi:hypothetical protein